MNNHKTLQLCRQIEQTLSYALADDPADDILLSLGIESVTPAPDASRVMVTVYIDDPDSDYEANEVLEHLTDNMDVFRDEIADAIHRRKLPELVFRVRRPDLVTP